MRFIAVLVLSLCFATSARAEWLKAETRHFTIYSEGGVESLRSFAIKVERFDTMLRKRNGISDADTPQRLTIFLMRDQRAVAKVHQGKNDSFVAGFYVPTGEGSLAVVNRSSSGDSFDLQGDEVLFHEYAHHFMMRYFPVAYPAWFIEGFAEFLATVDFGRKGEAKVGMPPYYRSYALALGAPVPIERLLTGSVDTFSSSELDPFYGKSWALVHFLSLSGSRTGQLDSYLKALNAGASNIDAARTAFGDIKQLGKDLDSYLKQARIHFLQDKYPTSAPERIDIARVSAAVGATMVERIMVMRGVGEGERAAVLKALNAAAAAHPDDPEPWLLIAALQFQAKDFPATIKAADAALALAPGSPRAMLYKGWAMARQNVAEDSVDVAKWKAARSWIVRANHADTNDPLPLYAYYQSFRMQGLDPGDLARQGLSRAYQMVPEDRTIRMTYASDLASQRQYAAAIRLVETLAYDPHGDEGADQARSILKRLRAAEKGDAPAKTDLFGDELEDAAQK